MTTTIAELPPENVTIPFDEYTSLLGDRKFLEALLASGAEVKTTEDTELVPNGELNKLAQEYYNLALAPVDGAGVVGDTILLIEVHQGDEPECAFITSGVPSHRVRGLLTEALSRLDAGDFMDGLMVPCDDEHPGEPA